MDNSSFKTYKSTTIHIVFTTIHSHHFMTQIHHISQLDHGAASLPVPSLSPSLDPPTLRTASAKLHPVDEEGRLKT
jgi:hypothetical protein